MENLVRACNNYIKVAQQVANIKFVRVELINLSKQDWESSANMQANMPSINTQDMKSDFKEFSKYYAQAMSLYTAAKIAAKASEASNDEVNLIKEAAKQLDEAHEKIIEDDYLKLIEDIMVLHEAMLNPKSFVVTSPPIQMNGDVVAFDVQTPPAQVNDLMPFTSSKTFQVEIPAKGGIKVDFSVGPVVSFGNNARDEKYYLGETTPANTAILRRRDNNNVISPGIAAMMHVYPRTGTYSALGGMFGVGAGFQAISDVNLSMFVGLTWVLGKSQKIMLSTVK